MTRMVGDLTVSGLASAVGALLAFAASYCATWQHQMLVAALLFVISVLLERRVLPNG